MEENRRRFGDPMRGEGEWLFTPSLCPLRCPPARCGPPDAYIEQLETQIKTIDVQLLASLARRVDPRQLALAASVPGIGSKTATTLLGYLPEDWRTWGGRKRIASKLQALCGIDPRLRQS